MDFCILGPLEARGGNVLVALGGSRQQTAMAMLLLEPERVVPVERLIEAVWGEKPPPTARQQIRICISNLRRVIRLRDGADPLITRSSGYLLRLGGCTLDAQVFDAKVHEGRMMLATGDLSGAAASLRSALSLWRGEALSGIESELIQRSVIHLNERRLGVLGECLEVELREGVGGDLISELISLAHENPLRERFSAMLMMALYQVGRQAEALETYRHTRSVLMDELAIEPGVDLQRVHEVILAGKPIADHAPQLAQTPPAPQTAGTMLAQTPTAAYPPSSAQRPGRPVPMVLPAAIPNFTGRSALIDQVMLAMKEIARVGERLGINPDTPRNWVERAEIDGERRLGTTSNDKKRIAELERENRELRRANEILKVASPYFARGTQPRISALKIFKG